MFISTILMVVVLVVALSTATFAWYTASSSADAKNASLTAAHSAAANIAVGWTSSATGTEIDLATDTAVTVAPMIPTAAPVLDTTKYSGESNVLAFNTASIDTEGKFGAPASATPWKIAHETQDKFYVINHNVNAGAKVSMTCTISGDNADKLLVAVFVKGTLAGIFTNRTECTTGEIAQDTLASTLAPATIAAKKTTITFDLAKEESAGVNHFTEISVMAWLDGAALMQDSANKSAQFSFTFGAETLPVE